MKDIRTLAAALLLATTSAGALAASATATITDVKVVVANLDPGNMSTPGYGVDLLFSDALAWVDGIVPLADERFGFMTPVSQSSLPADPGANSSASIAGATLTADAFALGSRSASAAASTGTGWFILEPQTSLTLSATLTFDSRGSGATTLGDFCLVTCIGYASGPGGTQVYTDERTVSNLTDDFEQFYVFLAAEADVVPVPEVSPLLQMLAGLATMGIASTHRRRRGAGLQR